MPQTPTSPDFDRISRNPDLVKKATPSPTVEQSPTLNPTPSPTTTPPATRTTTPTATPTPVNVPANPLSTTGVAATSSEPPDIDLPPSDFPYLPIAAAVVTIILATFLVKKLADRIKYGNNAGKGLRSLKKAISAKDELTKKWLKKKKSANIHAIGVGKIDGTDEYCIQVFVEDADVEMLEDPPTHLLPTEFRNFPIVIFEMPRADFLAADIDEARATHEVLKGGISGASSNLSGEVGTIGYFFRPNLVDRALHVFLKNHLYLLSNAHVFGDVMRDEIDSNELIIQPSPGDAGAKRAVATLFAKAPMRFDGDVENPNMIDAAIAKLNRGIGHILDIPGIGKVAGYLKKDQIELRSQCSKFGRTTGFTSGMVFSIHLSIWVKYSARGKEAFFSDQFLIVPTDGSSFVKGGDSGAIVTDQENRAIGLIFAGAGEKTSLKFNDGSQLADLQHLGSATTPKIENYGVANSISDVMSHFKVKLDT